MSKKLLYSMVTLKNSNLLTTGFGRLTPFFIANNIPRDRLKQGLGANVQLMPMLAPCFQDCRQYVHWYWVPERMLHINEEYNAFVSREQRTLATLASYPQFKSYTTVGDVVTALNNVYRNNSTGSVVPFDYSSGCILNQLPDYLRCQMGQDADYSKSSEKLILEPLVAYFKIFLDHYCSTQYKTSFILSTNIDGSYNYLSLSYEDVVWLFSYFQKIGFNTYLSHSTSVTLPSNVSVRPLALLVQIAHVQYGRKGDIFMELMPGDNETAGSQAVGSTIEALRLNSVVVRFKEKLSRVGLGAREFYREFFHLNSMDSKLQISRFLGGGRCNINIDDVAQTSATVSSEESDYSSALGELAGNGWKKSSFGFGRRWFDDYGYVIGLTYFVPKQAYFQGVDYNLWQRRTANDMYLEDFDSIGDEPVFQGELYQKSGTGNDSVIGYIPRYRRYDRVKDEIHGNFCNSLLYWHQSRLLPNTANAENIRQVFAKPQSLNRIFNYNGIVSEAGEQPIMCYFRIVSKWKRNKRYSPKPHII